MEAKYIRDYRRSYLILKCRQKEFVKGYPYKILSSQRITGILKCSIRYINGAAYLYYDISSRTTLCQLYQNKKMNCGQVRELLLQLCTMMAELNAYFLDERYLVVMPEYVYYDMSQKRYLGIYYPEYEENENYYEPLFDFLLNHIDTEDKQLAEDVYQIYEMSEEGCFSLEDALRLLEKETEATEEAGMYVQREMSEEEALYEQILDEYPDGFQKEDNMRDGCKRRNLCGESSRTCTFYSAFALLAALGMACAFGVRYFYELTQQEQLIIWGCMALMGGCFLFSLIQTVRSIKKKTGKENESDKLFQDDFFCENGRVSLDNVINKNMKIEMARADYFAEERREACKKQTDNMESETEPAYDNTVFFDRKEDTEYKLYALDRKNKKHITLVKFPYTVGKMAGYVDFVLPDDSVSRIHARFDKEGDCITLTDMNSTNGTFKNGLRMEPQETVELEPGDEIRFGKLNYCYR